MPRNTVRPPTSFRVRAPHKSKAETRVTDQVVEVDIRLPWYSQPAPHRSDDTPYYLKEEGTLNGHHFKVGWYPISLLSAVILDEDRWNDETSPTFVRTPPKPKPKAREAGGRSRAKSASSWRDSSPPPDQGLQSSNLMNTMFSDSGGSS